MYKIYGRNGCSACESAKTLLKQHNKQFEYLNFGNDYSFADFTALTTQKTFPLITKGDEIIGSFSDLILHFSNKENND